MNKLPEDFDWRSSPAHLDLLSNFEKPRDARQELEWFNRTDLKEHTREAVDRLVRNGALEVPSLATRLAAVLKTPELKQIAGEQGLKLSGSKADLIGRLVAADVAKLEKLLEKHETLQCSDAGREALATFEERKKGAAAESKQQSLDALRSGDAKEAYKARVTFARVYGEPHTDWDSYKLEELRALLLSAPEALGGLASASRQALRVAVCMEELWGDAPIDAWLPENVSLEPRTPEVAASYLRCHAQMLQGMSGDDATTVYRVELDSEDIDCCGLCTKYAGKTFRRDELPALPMLGCTSERGCDCHVYDALDGTDADQEEVDADRSGEGVDSETDGIEDLDALDSAQAAARIQKRLATIKLLLDAGAITPTEYDEKRKVILAVL